MSLPYTFVPFTTIYSAQVNANFQYVAIYDIAMGYLGTLPTSTTLFTFNVVRTFTLPAALSGSIFSLGGPPTSAIALTVQQNGATIGTINWAASATYATVSFASLITFSPGDQLTILTPSNTYNASNLAMTFNGSRV